MWNRDDFTFPTGPVASRIENELDAFDINTHDSLTIGIEELRRQYDEQEERRNAIETKVSGLVAINGIILSILPLPEFSGWLSGGLIFSPVFFTISICFCLWNLTPRNYRQPMSVKVLPECTSKQQSAFRQLIYKRYFSSVYVNSEINDVRFRWFLLSIGATGVGVLLLSVYYIVTTITISAG